MADGAYISWEIALARLIIGTGLDRDHCETLLKEALDTGTARSWVPELPPMPFFVPPSWLTRYVHEGDLEAYIKGLNGEQTSAPSKARGAPHKADWEIYYQAKILPKYRDLGPPHPKHGKGWSNQADVERLLRDCAEQDEADVRSPSTFKHWARVFLERAAKDC
jgi:hypothetical protein